MLLADSIEFQSYENLQRRYFHVRDRQGDKKA